MQQTTIYITSGLTTADPVVGQAIRTVASCAPGPIDICHVPSLEAPAATADRLSIILALNDTSAGADAYHLRAVNRDPLSIRLEGGSKRAILYAAHALRRAVRRNTRLEEIDEGAQPRVPIRLAQLPASTHFGGTFRPSLFDRTLDALPGMGANGVLLVPARTHGTPAGKGDVPFVSDPGGVRARMPEIVEWRAVLQRVEDHGLDSYLLCPAWVPPGFDPSDVKRYYNGDAVLDGYEDAVRAHMGDMLAAIFEHLPQVRGIVYHSLECPDLWGRAVSIFPCRDSAVGARVFEAYVGALVDECSKRNRVPCFWSHVAEMGEASIGALCDLVARHPDLINIVDHTWPNAGWPILPMLGYLPEPHRSMVHTHNRFGMFLDTTDGEYYGGGKLPTACPEPHCRGSDEAISREAEMVLVRLHVHDETHRGTLRSLNGIMPTAALRRLWSPSPDMTDVWLDWSRDAFGPDAAGAVVDALALCTTIMDKGLTAGGLNLIDHEGIPPYLWQPGGQQFALFGEPGARIAPSPDGLRGQELIGWQTGATAISIDDFRARMDEATRAAELGVSRIDAARELLSADDHAYLRGCFTDAIVVLDALRHLGEAAHAVQHEGEATAALQALECFADNVERRYGHGYFRVHDIIAVEYRGEMMRGPSLAVCLRAIAESYRAYATLER